MRFLLCLAFFLIQIVILNAYSLTLEHQSFIENKKKWNELIMAYSLSTLGEEKEALKKELQLTQLQIAKQLNSDLTITSKTFDEKSNEKIVIGEENNKSPQSGLTVLDKLDERSCQFYKAVYSNKLLEQFYLPIAPINKFWEGAQLLIRELTHINFWFRTLSESVHHNDLVKIESFEAEEIFKLLNDGSAISVLESLKRLEQFLESERITLVFKYDQIENLIPATFNQLHNIIENLELADKNLKAKESVLMDIFNIIESKDSLTQYTDRIDFMIRVILGDIIFRVQYEKKEDIKILALFDTLNNEDQNRVINLNKTNLACQAQGVLAKNNIYFTNPVFEINTEKINTNDFAIAPVLKPWILFVESKCLQLKQWQTNHSFWCDSDLQEGCDRSTASLCLPINK